MLDLSLSDEQRELRELAHGFAEERIRPVAWDCDRSGEWPADVVAGAWELGLVNASVPREYGGPGLDAIDECLIGEEVGWGCAGIGTTLGSSGLAVAPLVLGGSDELKREYLGRLTSAPTLAALCLSEPGVGSDIASIATRAARTNGGWRIDGTKTFITNGSRADWYAVYAKTDPNAERGGLSAFVVDRDAPGVSVEDVGHKMGQRAADTATIYFDGVEVPAENLLGTEGKGFKLAMMTLDRTRPAVASLGVGIARAALEFATARSMEATDGDLPIAASQAVQMRIADMATKVEAARLLVWQAALQVDRGERNTLASAHAKRFAGDAAMEVALDAVDLYGLLGTSEDEPIEKLMRDAKLMQIYEGTSQIQRLVIARETLLPRA